MNSLHSEKKRIYFIYISVFFENIALGAFIVTVAWLSIDITNKLSSTGQVFFVSHFITFFFGPFFGFIVDRVSRKKLIYFGQAINIIALLIPFSLFLLKLEVNIIHLYIVVVIMGFGTIFIPGAIDGLLQENTEFEDRKQVAATLGGIRQAAMIAGSGSAGMLLHYFGAGITFLIISICLTATVFSISFLSDSKSVIFRKKERNLYLETIKGFTIFKNNKDLLFLGILTSIAYSAGQLTNAILPSFIRDEIKLGSQAFGFVDASWSIGGIGASFLIVLFIKHFKRKYIEFTPAILLGISMICFSVFNNIMYLIIFHGLMGVFFSSCKVLCDGRILQICPKDTIGRVRTNIQSMISLTGMSIYLLPTFINTLSSKQFYIAGGILVCSMTIALIGLMNVSKYFSKIKFILIKYGEREL